MALDERIIHRQPLYWTAAVYRRRPNGSWYADGYLPTEKVTWATFLDRQMDVDRKAIASGTYVKLYPFYWDGKRWIRDYGFGRVAGSDAGGKGQAASRAGGSALSPLAPCDLQLASFSIGALERKSPLPVGRYWQDIFEKQARDWSEWVLPKLEAGTVKIVREEFFRADPLRSGEWLPDVLRPGTGEIRERSWFLFDVLSPVDWPATKLGFPTIATPDVKTSADTAINPPGPTPLEEIGDAVKGVTTPLIVLGSLFLGFKILQAFKK